MNGSPASESQGKVASEWARQGANSELERCFLGYQSLDAEGHLRDANGAWLNLLGFSRDEVIGKRFADFVLPPQRSQCIERLQQLRESGRTHALEFDLACKDGRIVTLSIDASPERANDSAISLVHCVVYEVTDRRRALESLQRSRTELRTIYDCTPVMMCVLNAAGRVLSANRAWAEFTGRLNANLLHEGLGEVLGCEKASPNARGCGSDPECETCVLRQAMADTLRTGQTRREIECWMTVSRNDVSQEVALLGSTAVIAGDGEPTLLLCLEDVTQRKRTEEQRRAGEEKFRRILDMLHEGFWSVDASHRCTYANQNFAEMLGYRVEEIINRPMIGFTFDEDQAETREWETELSRESHARKVIRLRRKDGGECWMVVSASSEKDAKGCFAGALGMAIDVTRQKADESKFELLTAQLRHATRLATLGELVAGIAHEINQPLCSIVNFAKACRNLASQPQPDLARIREWSEAIAASAARGGDIVRRLCGFARPSQEQPAAVAIQELVDDATMLLRFELQSRKVALTKDMPDKALMVKVYPVQIHQVLVNLLRNAIEALGDDRVEPGQLKICTRLLGEEVHVSMIDNGTGLPCVGTGSIFDAFFSTKREQLGLGLAISRSIIEAHSGRIWAEPHPDRGAIVHFTLPLLKEEAHHDCRSNDLRG